MYRFPRRWKLLLLTASKRLFFFSFDTAWDTWRTAYCCIFTLSWFPDIWRDMADGRLEDRESDSTRENEEWSDQFLQCLNSLLHTFYPSRYFSKFYVWPVKNAICHKWFVASCDVITSRITWLMWLKWKNWVPDSWGIIASCLCIK